MSYGTITTTTTTFEDRGNGLYVDASKLFGEPSNTLKIRSNSNPKAPSVVVTRAKQIDYLSPVTSKVTRILGTVQVVITVPPAGFTPVELDNMLAEISQFATSTSLSEMLQGKS